MQTSVAVHRALEALAAAKRKWPGIVTDTMHMSTILAEECGEVAAVADVSESKALGTKDVFEREYVLHRVAATLFRAQPVDTLVRGVGIEDFEGFR